MNSRSIIRKLLLESSTVSILEATRTWKSRRILFESDGIDITVFKEEPRDGYVYRHEQWDSSGLVSDLITMDVAYSIIDGSYIGDIKEAERLRNKYGVVPEAIPGTQVSSIGYSDKDGKWYGWSHRAIYGFSIGDTVTEGDSTIPYLPIGFEAKTKDDAKKMAIAFARSVS